MVKRSPSPASIVTMARASGWTLGAFPNTTRSVKDAVVTAVWALTTAASATTAAISGSVSRVRTFIAASGA
jgi:hypothetical protein